MLLQSWLATPISSRGIVGFVYRVILYVTRGATVRQEKYTPPRMAFAYW
jgi:hypothetical protein